MIRASIKFVEGRDGGWMIKCKPGILLLCTGIVFVGAAIFFALGGKDVLPDQSSGEILFGVCSGFIFGAAAIFLWLSGWQTVTLIPKEGIDVKTLFKSFTIPGESIVWARPYVGQKKSRTSPSVIIYLYLRVELPNDRKRGIKDFETRVIDHEVSSWAEREVQQFEKLKEALASTGFGVPEDLEKALDAGSGELNWLKRNGKKHPNPHVGAVCIKQYIKKGDSQKDYHSTIEEFILSKEPLSVYAAAQAILSRKQLPGYSLLLSKHKKSLATSLEKMESANNTPDYLKTQLGAIKERIRYKT